MHTARSGSCWLVLASLTLTGCAPTAPPAQRPAVTLSSQHLTGNAIQGKAVFDDECSKCHQLSIGKNSKGPQLSRIWGASAGTLADYQSRYSTALRNSQIIWNDTTLAAYLEHPKQRVPQGKMLYDGLPDHQQRQDVIAYLATLK
jgi:cytochrome c